MNDNKITIGMLLLIIIINVPLYIFAGFCTILLLNLIGMNLAVNLGTSTLMALALACINGMKNSLFPGYK